MFQKISDFCLQSLVGAEGSGTSTPFLAHISSIKCHRNARGDHLVASLFHFITIFLPLWI